MNTRDELEVWSRRALLIFVVGDAPFVPHHAARHRIKPCALLARSTNTYISTNDELELLFGQCNRILRFILHFALLVALLRPYRLHVSHLRRITDRFVRMNSRAGTGGGQEIIYARCSSEFSN